MMRYLICSTVIWASSDLGDGPMMRERAVMQEKIELQGVERLGDIANQVMRGTFAEATERENCSLTC